MKMRCKDCRFVEKEPKNLEYSTQQPACKRFPQTVMKTKDDYCFEFETEHQYSTRLYDKCMKEVLK